MFRAIRSVFSAQLNNGVNLHTAAKQWSLGWTQSLCIATAGILLSGSTAMATPKSPAKDQLAYRSTVQVSQVASVVPVTSESDLSEGSTVSGTLADGIYFFGAAPERDRLGAEYVVFEVENDQVTGAFYLPASNFDCFQGEVQANALALQITDSYDQAVHSFDMALAPVSETVAGSGAGSFGPAGFHSLGQPSDLEYQLLSTCQANYADAI